MAIIGYVVIAVAVVLVSGIAIIRAEDKYGSKPHDSSVLGSLPPVVEVSVEDFDKFFDRSAGRYCQHCGIYGSHHTDRHNEFANLVKSKLGNS